LSNDPEAEGKIIEDSIEEKAQKALAQAQRAQQPNNNSQE
jgi:hypothetical protein